MYHKLNIPVIQGSKSNKMFKPNLKTGHYLLENWTFISTKLGIPLNKTGHYSLQNTKVGLLLYKDGCNSLQNWALFSRKLGIIF